MLVAMCASLFLVNVDNTVVNVALPTIGERLAASTTDLQWVVDAFAVVFAGFLFAAGGLGDRFGHRRVLLTGLTVLGAGALAGAFASPVGVLIGARAVMGFGAALTFPATLAILTAVYREPAQRARAIGVWTAVAGLAVAVGPLLGGWLLQTFWWGSVLLVNVPIAAVAVIAVGLLVPEVRQPRPRPLDVAGAVLSIAAISTAVIAIVEGPRLGWASVTVLGCSGAAVLLGAGFVWRARTAAAPMLDLRLFADRGLRIASAGIAVAFFALLGFVFLATQYLQLVLGYGTLAAGACIVPAAVGIGVGSGVAPALAARLGARTVIAGGLALLALGLAMAGTLRVDSPLPVFATAIALIGFGVGAATAPGTELIVAAVPRTMAGVGAAINDTTRELGGALGVAIIGSIAVSVYRHNLTDLTGLPAATMSVAQDSLAAALQAANAAPDRSQALADAAREAFVAGFATASWAAAAAVAVIAATVAVSAFRSQPTRVPTALPAATPDHRLALQRLARIPSTTRSGRLPGAPARPDSSPTHPTRTQENVRDLRRQSPRHPRLHQWRPPHRRTA